MEVHITYRCCLWPLRIVFVGCFLHFLFLDLLSSGKYCMHDIGGQVTNAPALFYREDNGDLLER